MKYKLMRTVIAAIVVVAITSGCMEHRYYQKNNQHSENYNKRHHRGNQPRLDINLHN
jgi:hypothetical protein